MGLHQHDPIKPPSPTLTPNPGRRARTPADSNPLPDPPTPRPTSAQAPGVVTPQRAERLGGLEVAA